jgi:biotin carboxyl carrier protein
VENGEPRADGVQPAYRVHFKGYDYDVSVDDERSLRIKGFAEADGRPKDAGRIVAPMPGLVVKLLVEPGQEVRKGEGLVIVEAMKMENEIRSPVSGKVEKINVIERQAVEKGQILAVIG